MAGKKGRSGRHPKIVLDDSDIELIDLIDAKEKPLVINSRIVQIISGLAEIGCPDHEIAAVLGVARRTFGDFVDKKQPWIRALIEDRRDKSSASLRRTQEDVVQERVMNICQECGKIKILFMAKNNPVKFVDGETRFVDAFLTECPYCGEDAIKHEYMPPNPTMLVWLGKQKLGQSDKNDVRLSGNPDAPIVVTTLAEFVMNSAKQKEHGSKKG